MTKVHHQVIQMCHFAIIGLLLALPLPMQAQNPSTVSRPKNKKIEVLKNGDVEKTEEKTPRLTVGGYGEAVYTRNFYSDNMFRYSHAERYKNAKGHGRVDLPHVVISIGYDFGKGWSMAAAR